MSDELTALHALAKAMGVATHYVDGLKRPVDVGPDTLVRVCAALGAPVERPADAAAALPVVREANARHLVPPVLVAWEGRLGPIPLPGSGKADAELRLEDGSAFPLELADNQLRAAERLPFGHHTLTVERPGIREACTIIAAPELAFRRPGTQRSWGLASQLAALRSARSRTLGDLWDLETLCRWVGDRGGDLVMVLPLLPTFNNEWPEPSPYSPVSRLFWSELVLDLGEAHRPTPRAPLLDVRKADAEVRAALAGHPLPDASQIDDELRAYARFRGAQIRLGRNWRDWPAAARAGTLTPEIVDGDEERFHLVAQIETRRQLQALRERLDRTGMRLGFDLAVGVHADGYDPWSRQSLFGAGMSVGAPPDGGFPSGQDWGFPPVLPGPSRLEGHRYVAASIAHQMKFSGVLRVDHIMAWTRLYWIPHGFGLHEGTYVKYPADELFAILTLESQRHRCEIVGENLGTVPPEIGEALPRHRIWGMYLAQFSADEDPEFNPPTARDAALIGTHDTPTWAEWLAVGDIAERVEHRLLPEADVPRVREQRAVATERLASHLEHGVDEPRELLADLLEWLGASESPLVVPWIEDLWFEEVRVNLPATLSSDRPNWQRPMKLLLDEIFTDPGVDELIRRLHRARNPE
jgi:4-alpha-glucanotransferase